MLVKLRLNIADLNHDYYQDCHLNLNLSEEEGPFDVIKKLACVGLYAYQNVEVDKDGFLSDRPFLMKKNFSDEVDFAVEYRLINDKLIKSFFNHSRSRKFVFFSEEDKTNYTKKHKDIFSKHSDDCACVLFEEFELEAGYFKRNKEATITIDGSNMYVNFDDLSLVSTLESV